LTGTVGPDRPVILVVEDELANRVLLRAILKRSDVGIVRSATVIEAADLATARSVLVDSAIDLVLLDVRLPDGSGLSLAEELRTRPGVDRPGVIVLSASVLPDEREAALAAGADLFLSKPYSAAALTDAIARALARRRVNEIA
jgi:two-component system KDP operon response regulator KdpE